jgi:succinate dehydrogenase / fumarate reductase, iron-sulfur subunit
MATQTATFKIWRTHSSEPGDGTYQTFQTEVTDGMVVLDVVHKIQAEQAPDLAVRWNCKAGKCGSCSAEINGNPRLMCMTRMSQLNLWEPVTVEPMRTFPPIKDLVTDVSWNFRVKKTIQKFRPKEKEADGTRNSASASSASCARTSATSCATTTSTTSSSARVSSSTRRTSR